MKTIEKDILTVEQGIIVHCCNAQGKMNSGIAKAIREKWPQVFNEYLKFLDRHQDKALGDVNIVEIVPKRLYVANLIGQKYYGYDGKRYVSYGAWETALPILKEENYFNLPVYFPFLVGSCRAGGNFVIIRELIAEHFPNAIFCKL